MFVSDDNIFGYVSRRLLVSNEDRLICGLFRVAHDRHLLRLVRFLCLMVIWAFEGHFVSRRLLFWLESSRFRWLKSWVCFWQ